jgi:hypothetical protein
MAATTTAKSFLHRVQMHISSPTSSAVHQMAATLCPHNRVNFLAASKLPNHRPRGILLKSTANLHREPRGRLTATTVPP